MMFFLYLVFPINLIFKVLFFIKKLNNLLGMMRWFIWLAVKINLSKLE